MTDLGLLFNKYGSDKDRNGYTALYRALWNSLQTKPIDLLEIGIGTMIPGVQSSMVGYALPGYAPGGSLRAWRDYFTLGNIVGCDIQPDTQFTEDRIVTYLANSSDKKQLDAVLGDRMFDIIIDDGLHWDEYQVKTMENLWGRVKPGGYYVIEDVTVNSRIPTEFRPKIEALAGKQYFLTEIKNVLVATKPAASEV